MRENPMRSMSCLAWPREWARPIHRESSSVLYEIDTTAGHGAVVRHR
jgi:hypothetical protein